MGHRKIKYPENKNSFRWLAVILVLFLLLSSSPVSVLTAVAASTAGEGDAFASSEESVTRIAGTAGTEPSESPPPASPVTEGEDENEKSNHALILSFDELDSLYAGELAVAAGTDLANLSLPAELGVVVEREGSAASETVPVTWVSDPVYDGNVTGSYLLTPVLEEGYVLAEGVELPHVVVKVIDSEGLIQPFAGGTVLINGSMSEAQIQTAIQNELSSYNSIVVLGTKTNAAAELSLTIPQGKKVIWKAKYESSPTLPGALLMLPNFSGTFEVSAGGSIVGNHSGAAINMTENTFSGHVDVNGGTVTANGLGIYTNGASITVSGGGSVASQNSQAIFLVPAVNPTSITVSGGTVSSASSGAIRVIGVNAQVTVSGTGVVTGATGSTIQSTGNVTVQDSGKVMNTGSGSAISAKDILVSGGLVFASAGGISGTGNVVSPSGNFSVTGDAVVIGWDADQGVRQYLQYKKKDISLLTSEDTAAVAKAYWDSGSGHGSAMDGIAYSNGANSGFIPLPVTVINRVSVTLSKEIEGTYANMQEQFTFKLIFMNSSDGSPVTTRPVFTYTGGTLPGTGAAAPPGDSITLDESGTATVTLGHGQTIILDVPLGYKLEIQELLSQGSMYTPSVQTDIGGVEDSITGATTIGPQEIDDNAVIAYVNRFEEIVPTGITPGADALWILLLSAGLLVSAAAVPEVIRRRRWG